MTKLLDLAITEIQRLSEEEQDKIAAELMAYVAGVMRDGLQLSEEQLAELRQRRAAAHPLYVSLRDLRARIDRLRA